MVHQGEDMTVSGERKEQQYWDKNSNVNNTGYTDKRKKVSVG